MVCAHRMLAQLWKQRRPLLLFALSFQLLENLLFAPSMAWLGGALQGRPVVDSTALVEFFLSPRGFLVLFLGATMSVTLRLVEHAGLSAIVFGALEGKSCRAWATFRWLVTELPGLGRIAVRVIGWGLLLALPPLTAAGLLAPRLLRQHDINYYLANRPGDFLLTAFVVGALAFASLTVGAWLFIRWRLVVQVCVFDGRAGKAAFQEAAALSRGVRVALARRCLALLGLLALLLITAAALQQLAVGLLLRVAGTGELSMAVSFGVIVLVRTGIGAAVTSLGACADAAAFTAFHRERRRALGGEPTWRRLEQAIAATSSIPVWARGLAAALAAGLLAAGGASVTLAVGALGHEGPITVTAHRGDHHRAPENTLAAVREAIAAGADFAEIDVQLSKDGILVVTHDSDFSRMAGVAKRVWDLTYAEIRALPLGAKSAPEFAQEVTPTLDEVLTVASNRIRLNLELKYYGDHQPRLAERVVEAVRAHGMSDQVIIQCLEYEPLQEIRRLAPKIPIGYLLSVNASHPGRLDVDFLGVALNRATGAFVQAAHRRGQRVHVWTVDKPADMDRLIALGVDDLITNEPAEAVRRVRAFQALTQPERTLLRVRAWLTD
jgi:glycerophosphoryl diester phosphodiesterase